MAWFVVKFGLLWAALASVVSADPKVVKMSTYRTERKVLVRRAEPFNVTLGNAAAVGLYYVNASVGTPPQLIQLQIDTGSSDVWMFGPNSCNVETSPCLGGEYVESQSSTATLLAAGTFNIQYVTPNSGVTGNYFSDDFSIGGVTVENLTMAVATEAAYVATGVMGIGFDTDESSAFGGYIYPNIIDDMVTQDLINARAYSLWLDDLNSSTGTVLFGGYDTAKYTGDLQFLPIEPDIITGNITSFSVNWTSLSLTDFQGTNPITAPNNFSALAVLDSGTTFTGLPTEIYNFLAEFLSVVNDATYGALVACNISSYNATLDYGFGGSNGPVITVPLYELAIPAVAEDGNPLTFPDGSAACSFGLFPTESGEEILFGDTFLRSAYVLYDLDALQIGIAQTIFNTNDTNVQAVGTNGSIGNSTGPPMGNSTAFPTALPTAFPTAISTVFLTVTPTITDTVFASAFPSAFPSAMSSAIPSAISSAVPSGNSTEGDCQRS